MCEMNKYFKEIVTEFCGSWDYFLFYWTVQIFHDVYNLYVFLVARKLSISINLCWLEKAHIKFVFAEKSFILLALNMLSSTIQLQKMLSAIAIVPAWNSKLKMDCKGQLCRYCKSFRISNVAHIFYEVKLNICWHHHSALPPDVFILKPKTILVNLLLMLQ